jgi:superfamily II DNA or RNA helicase
VKKASEGFDAPSVSVLLKLDAVHSREPVVQQLGRGLRYNSELPEAENVLNVFIGRDPRLLGLIEHLEREAPAPPAQRGKEPLEELQAEDQLQGPHTPELDGPEIVDVVEAGDAYLDHTGRFVEGQQLTMFGVPAPAAVEVAPAPVQVADIAGELQDAISYCTTWTNRAARERARRYGPGENHYASLNLAYARETGRRGTLATPAEYRHKGDWMKRRYMELLG